MRKVPGYAKGESTFTPDVTIKDWRNLDDDDPILVTIQGPTAAELRAFYTKHLKDETESITVLLVSEYVTKVESYLSPSGDPIATAEDLITYGEWAVLEAITFYLMGITTEEKKTSEELSE